MTEHNRDVPKHDRDMTVTWTRTWHTWLGHDYSLTKTWPGTVNNLTKTEVWHDWEWTRTWQDQEITLIWPWHVRNMTWDMTTSWHVHHRYMAGMVPNSIQARPPCHYQVQPSLSAENQSSQSLAESTLQRITFQFFDWHPPLTSENQLYSYTLGPA